MHGAPDRDTSHRDPPRSWLERLKEVGPGIIITASIVGSGELIATTKLGAEVGFTLLWFIILGCIVKVFVQVELGRYTVSSGKTTLETLNSIPGPRLGVSWMVWLWLLMYLAVLFQVSGIVGGVADIFTPRLAPLAGAPAASLPIEPEPSSDWQSAMSAYRGGDYSRATTLFAGLAERAESTGEAAGETRGKALWYLGNAEMLAEDAEGARTALETLVQSGSARAGEAGELLEHVRRVEDRRVLCVLLVAFSCAALLVIGRYGFIERASTLMVFLFTTITIAAVGALQWTDYRIEAAAIGEGLRFEFPSSGVRRGLTTAFATFGIIGVGASELIYYPYWCLEKGYARFVGPREDTPQWRARASGWIRVMKLDAWISLVIYTAATVSFYLLGAAVLHAKGRKVGDIDLIGTLSHMYRESFGELGYWIFLVGAFMVLYSTLFVSTGSNGRLFADALSVFRVCRYRTSRQRATVARAACALIPAVGATLFLLFGTPVTLVMVGGVAQALLLPFLAFSAVYLRYRLTDRGLAPGPIWTGLLWVSSSAMAALGVFELWNKLQFD